MGAEIPEQTIDVLSEVAAERAKQESKWGQQNHDAGSWLAILWMTRAELSRKVRTVIAEQLDMTPFEVSEDETLLGLGADSLDVVEIQIACEDLLGITSPFDSLPGHRVRDYVNYYAEIVGVAS